MNNVELATLLSEGFSTFIHLSLHDFNHFARAAGLSLAQMNVLIHLYYCGSSEMTSFCEMLQISPAGASQMIERMVQEGMVQRAEMPADRRVHLVSLTEAGRRVVLDSMSAHHAWIAQLTETLSDEERERVAEVVRMLEERAQHLQIHAHPAPTK